jgi:RNA polymerase sigma-70 factor (ECF subfamily)
MEEYASLDDATLVRRAKDDKQAFGELYERYVKKVYSYVYYRTNNHHDAEDLTAKVFIRALKHIKTYDERGVPFSAWLYRIAHNLVANWHRDHRRRQIIPLEDFIGRNASSDQPETIAEEQEELERLRQSIQRLPEERQQLLFLKYVDRLPNAEIGKIMDKTEGAIKSLYYRTLAALREELAHYQAERSQTSLEAPPPES